MPSTSQGFALEAGSRHHRAAFGGGDSPGMAVIPRNLDIERMNGATSLVRTLLASGVNVCFANPGTSEMHFVAALDAHPDMRCILCLFEGGATGAADGYFRMTGQVAASLLHLAPGFANGFANLHNARKARSAMLTITGDHATYHQQYDSPLKGDTLGLAQTISHWTRMTTDAHAVASDGAAAIRAARSLGGQIATLILPADTAWDAAEGAAIAAPPPALRKPTMAAVAALEIRLNQVPMREEGMTPFELMLSESQEHMLVAAPAARRTSSRCFHSGASTPAWSARSPPAAASSAAGVARPSSTCPSSHWWTPRRSMTGLPPAARLPGGRERGHDMFYLE